MSSEETILFVAVIALGLTLVAVVVGPKMRAGRRRRAGTPAPVADAPPAVAPAPLSASRDGGATVEAPAGASVLGPPAPPPVAGEVTLTCPTCRRSFSAGLRFCPYDARLLTEAPGGTPGGQERFTTDDGNSDAHGAPGSRGRAAGKICPTCARRYELGAVVCAHDGVALVSVN